MKLDQEFKKQIAATFYDKTVIIYSHEDSTDEEGWTRPASLTETGTFLGNVRFSQLDKIQAEYGLTDTIDIAITTDEDVPANKIIGYNDIEYMVTRSIPFDSHRLLLAKKWESKSSGSSGLPSA